MYMHILILIFQKENCNYLHAYLSLHYFSPILCALSRANYSLAIVLSLLHAILSSYLARVVLRYHSLTFASSFSHLLYWGRGEYRESYFICEKHVPTR